FGWALFALGLPLFFWLARRVVASESEAVARGRRSATALGGTTKFAAKPVVLALVALAFPAAWNQAIRPAPPPGALAGNLLPSPPPQWTGPAVAGSDWRPVFESADAQVAGRYRSGPAEVEVFIAYYREQSQGRELGAYHNDPAGGGQRIASSSTEAADRRFN